jgi:putative serine protease PepD
MTNTPDDPPALDPWAPPRPRQAEPPAWWLPQPDPTADAGPAPAGPDVLEAHSGTGEHAPDPTAGYDTLGQPIAGQPPRRTGVLVFAAIILALVAGLLGGVAGAWWANRDTPLTEPGASLGSVPSGSLARPPESVAGIAQRVLPVVVSIDVRGNTGDGGTGSGFIVRADGYIITNNHVVADASGGGTITVHFNDGSTASGRIVGRSPAYDLAVVKVARTGLPIATLGDSDDVVVGDQCIAIGSPLGLAGTVTSGIISATHRPVTTGTSGGSDPSYLSALQTDAAINPGNSGGPLVDGQGRVIGVNSAIATLGTTGSAQSGSIGLGFSIPVNQARRVAEQLIQRGYATYPVVGAGLDPTFDGNGVRVARIAAGGGAEKAGLQVGDIVVSVDGKPVTAPEQLIVAIRSKQPGDTVRLGYQRGGAGSDTTMATVTLGEARG